MQMPGRPALQRFCQLVAEAGGDDVIFDHMAEGGTMREIAERLGGFSRVIVSAWRDMPGPQQEERKRRWKEAMRASADPHAEIAGEVLDGPMAFPAQVQQANSRSNYHKWLAGVRNREDYGDAKQQASVVNISIGSLHLDALRQRGSMDVQRVPVLGPVVDAEVIEEGEDVISAFGG